MLTSTITVHYAEPELSWFLAQDSWDIKKTFVANPASPSVLFKSFVTNIQAWLRDWATHGHNLFIHRHLYQPGLPYYLEDAYTTLAAYLAKTEETEEIVMQILENRATKLCQQSVLLEGVETLDTKDHLARTQALLVYTLIRLFDGCPRQRALAEEGLCTLAQWCCQMREAAVVEAPRLYGELGRLRPGEGGLELGVWQAWILSESLRRTWMIISATMHIYQMKKDGWAGCSGFLLFTTRQGLWEAPNAWRWVQQLRTQSPLFAQTENVVELMEDTPPTEMDAFTNQVLSIVLSPEAIDRWVTKTTQIEGQQPDGSLMLQQALQ
ncbi:Fc.00g022140.m01.CDS01 [Cosmosporella sp. VM-42]